MIEHPDSSHQVTGPKHDSARNALERQPLLDAASAVTVSVEILKESYDEIVAVARSSGYDEQDAVRIVLLSGLGYEAGRLHLDALNRAASFEHELSAARVNEIVSELAGYHSMYSVLKYKAFKLYKQNQRLEFNNAGLRAQEVMWNEWADRMRRERETRDAETLRLRSLLSEFSLDWAAEGGPALPPGLIKAAQMPDVLQDDPPAEEPAALEPQVSSASPIEPMTGLWTRVLRFLKLR